MSSTSTTSNSSNRATTTSANHSAATSADSTRGASDATSDLSNANANANANSSLRAFYDGLFFSPIFRQNHRICCNVGFHLTNQDGNPLRNAIVENEHPNDRFQLQLYEELVLSLPLPVHELAQVTLKAIDLGCGPGGGLIKLQCLLPKAEFIGIDNSSQAIARCQENWQRFAPTLTPFVTPNEPRFYHNSAEQLAQIAANSIDLIFAVQSFQEMENTQQVIYEMHRVLKVNGIVCIADFIPEDKSLDRVHRALNEFFPASYFEFITKRSVSFNAAMACKLGSSSIEELIHRFLPQDFHEEMENFFYVKKTFFYDKLRLGTIGYQFLYLRKLPGAPDLQNLRGLRCVAPRAALQQCREDDEDMQSDVMPFIPDGTMANFYAYRDLFPELEVLKSNFEVIYQEMLKVEAKANWPFWPEKHYLSQDADWRVFPFCYTFPAYDASKTVWVPGTCKLCPNTVAVLQSIPGVRTALFSRLGPNTRLTPHRGYADLANHTLRCHLPLAVPTLSDGSDCCAMVVGGEAHIHHQREVLVFDDSKVHFAYNHHPDQSRIVLMVDLDRPGHLPRGKARGGHTQELDDFIRSFGKVAS